jgi:predicted porin
MKQTLSIIFFLLVVNLFLQAQNPASPDTIVKTNVAIQSDTTIKVAPVKQQEQPAAKPVRKDTRPWKDRIDFDVNTSFWANTSQVFGQITILVSYRFPKILSIGTGPTYLFNYQRGLKQNLNGFGGIVFAKAQLLKFVYLWTEYQGIDNQHYVTDKTSGKLVREFEYVDSWFLGAGVNIRLGKRNGINMSVLYDILYGSDSPYYAATTYRIGFSF